MGGFSRVSRRERNAAYWQVYANVKMGENRIVERWGERRRRKGSWKKEKEKKREKKKKRAKLRQGLAKVN